MAGPAEATNGLEAVEAIRREDETCKLPTHDLTPDSHETLPFITTSTTYAALAARRATSGRDTEPYYKRCAMLCKAYNSLQTLN